MVITAIRRKARLGAGLVGAAWLAWAVASCGGPRGGTDVGNGASVSVDAQQVGIADASSPPILLPNGVTIEEAWLGLERIKLLGGSSCASSTDQAEPDIAGPFAADLLRGGVTGEKPEAAVIEGKYCGFQVALHELASAEVPASAPSDLIGASLFVAGRRVDGRQFTVKTSRPIKLVLHADKGRAFDLRDEQPLILGIDLPALVAALDLDKINGMPIVIDDRHNVDNLARALAALRKTSALYEDKNADGQLSGDETSEDDKLAKGI